MYNYSNQKLKGMFGDIEEQLKLKGVYNTSDYVKLANQIDWDKLCTPLEKAYCMNNGRGSINTRRMLALEILKHMLKLSDEKLVHRLQTNLEIQYFCGIQNMYEDTTMESSSLTHFRNRLAKHPEILTDIQNIHLIETIRKLPKKKQGQYDQDGTVIEEKIKYPSDVELLKDVVQKGANLIGKAKIFIKNTGKKMITRGKRLAKDLYLTYSFTKKKTKEICEDTRKKMASYANSMIHQMQRVYKSITHIRNHKIGVLKQKIKEYLKVGKEIMQQQKYMMKTGIKSIKQRILSLAKPYIRPIIKGKQGKRIQFGAKAHVGLVGGKVAVAVGLSRENEHEGKHIMNGVNIVEHARGKPPSEVGYDKGGRSKEVYQYLEERGITNGIQGSAKRKELTKSKRKRLYNRRAFVENVINDVLNHRCVNGNLYAQQNTQWSFLMGCMASNLVRIR